MTAQIQLSHEDIEEAIREHLLRKSIEASTLELKANAELVTCIAHFDAGRAPRKPRVTKAAKKSTPKIGVPQ